MVKPCRMGSAPAPTKLSQPERNIKPSIGLPAGLGLSKIHTLLLCKAAASKT